MPRQKSARTWSDWQEINPFLFPRLIELRNDPGFVGWALQAIPEEIVRDADRCPDPWGELSRVRILEDGNREFCRAAASLVAAVERLAGMAWGEGSATSNVRDRLGEAIEREDHAATSRLTKKLFRAGYKADSEKLKAAVERSADENNIACFNTHEAELKRSDAKHPPKENGQAAPEPPSFLRLCQCEPISVLLVVNWLRCGPVGDPGFCFFSSHALANFFSLLNWTGFDVRGADISEEQIEQSCSRRGLLKASAKFPMITDAFLTSDSKAIELNTLEAKQARSERPDESLKVRAPIVIAGRTLYHGTRR